MDRCSLTGRLRSRRLIAVRAVAPHRRGATRERGLAVAGCVAFALPVAVAWASVGVGVGAQPITLARAAHAGHSYRLNSLYVVNTGTERSSYGFRVRRYRPFRPGHRVSPRWIRFDRRFVTLNGGQAINVAVTLHVPRGATPGAYVSDIAAYYLAPGHAGTNAGVAAATLLRFRVSRH